MKLNCRKNWRVLKKSNGLSEMTMKENWKRKFVFEHILGQSWIDCFKEQHQVLSKRIEQLEMEKKDLSMRTVLPFLSRKICSKSQILLHRTLALLQNRLRWLKIGSRYYLYFERVGNSLRNYDCCKRITNLY